MRPTLTVIADPADRWMTRAACVGQAPAYDETASQWEQRKAQAVCLTSCPVLEECREWARRTKFTGTGCRREVPLRPPSRPPRPAGAPPHHPLVEVEEQQAS